MTAVIASPATLYPTIIDFVQHSTYGTHHMRLGAREWNSVGAGGDLGSFEAWNTTTIDAEAMIDEFILKAKVFFHTTSEFDTVTILTMASPTSPAIPKTGKALAVAGTNSSSSWRKAVQQHWTFRDTGWNESNFVFLDTPFGTTFDPTSDPTGITEVTDMIAVYTADSNAWSSRKNLQPTTFRKISYTLNNALRKQYGMV